MNRSTIATLLLIAFYAIYFGKMLLQRRRGIRTNQMGRGEKPRRLLFLERLLSIATYTVVAAELYSIFLGPSPLPSPLPLLGAVLGALGVTVFGLSVYTMGDSWRAGIPQEGNERLITAGIYRYSRNPAFLGFDLLYLGILLLLWNGPLLLFTLFAILMLHLQILAEESTLPATFGEEYLFYTRQVNRYLGRRTT